MKYLTHISVTKIVALSCFVFCLFLTTQLKAQGFYNKLDSVNLLYPNDTEEDGKKATIIRANKRWAGTFNNQGSFTTAAQKLYNFTTTFQAQRATSSGCSSFLPTWKEVGPTMEADNVTNLIGAGQINRMTFHPNYDGVTNKIIFGISGYGGIWKSIDDGENWVRLDTDNEIPYSTCGVLVIDPVNPNRMYVSTGAANGSIGYDWIYRDYPTYTIGVYATDNGGVNWTPINSGFPPTLFSAATISNMAIDPLNHKNLILTSTEGVFITTNADQSLLAITWAKDLNFTYTSDLFLTGLTYNPTTFEWFISGKNMYTCTNPFAASHNWALATGPTKGLDITGGIYTATNEGVSRVMVTNSPFFPNTVFTLIYLNTSKILISKITGAFATNTWVTDVYTPANTFAGGLHKDKMAFLPSPNANEYYYGSTHYGFYNAASNILGEQYGNSPINFTNHADVHGLYIHPSVPTKFWLCGDGGIAKNDVVLNDGMFNGFIYKNKGIQSQLLYGFDDSEIDPDYYLAGLQDNGQQSKGGASGNTWKECYFGGDGYAASILDGDPSQAFITSNGFGPQFFNYLNNSTTPSPFGSPLESASLFNDPTLSTKKIFIGDWNLLRTDATGAWGSTANYANTQIILNYNSTSFCFNRLDSACHCVQTPYRTTHTYNCASTTLAYGISRFEPSPHPTCGVAKIPSLIFKSLAGYDDYMGQNFFSNVNPITNALYTAAKTANAITATDIPYLRDIACNPTNGDHVWVCSPGLLSNFKVWKSLDGGTTWVNADSLAKFANIPVFELEVVNNQQETVFAGTLDGVYYTDNTMGGTWCRYGSGPSVQILGMKINYTKNTLLISTYGRGAHEVNLPPNAAAIVNIGTNTTWNTTQNYNSSKIIVKTGKTLTIQNTTCYFGVYSSIYVEAGAKLIINNATLTSDQCNSGNLWKGIELQGDYTKKQQLTGGYYPYHGWCLMLNNAIVQNAVVGIKNNATVNNDGITIDYAKQGGGIVQSINSKFMNCKVGAQFINYINYNALNIPISEKSYFTATQFLTDKTTAPLYHLPTTHLSLTNTKGIGITSCTFKNLTPTSYANQQRGNGIISYDAVYSIATPCTAIDINNNCTSYGTPNTFENLYYAVDAAASLPTNSVKVNNAVFTNNLRAVTLHGMEFAQVLNNTMSLGAPFINNTGVGTGTQIYPACGIYLDGCDAYAVQTNTINHSLYPASNLGFGIVASSSEYNPNELKLNKFTNIAYAIQTQDNNDGLQLKCNKFTTASISKADIITYGSIAPEQGLCDPDEKKLPGNEFSHTCNSAQDLSAGSVGQVNYNTRTSLNLETPQLGCYNATYYNVLNCIGAGNGLVCPPSSGAFSGSLNPIQLTLAIQTGKQDLKALTKLLTNGDKPALYTAIANGNDNQVYNKLLQQSPYLSDAVLLALLAHKPAFTENTIKAILLANSPLSTNIYQIAIKLNLSAVTQNAIKNAQMGTSQRTYTERNIAYQKSQLTINYNYLLNVILNDQDNVQRFQNLLAKLDNSIKPNANALKASILVEQQLFAAAQTEIDSLQTLPRLQAHLSNLNQIRQTANQKAAYKNGIKLAFDSLKATRPLTVGVKAQALYNGLFIKPFGELIYMGQAQQANVARMIQTEKLVEKFENGIVAFPNPTNTYITFKFGNDTQTNCNIEIYNANGQLVKNKTVNAEDERVQIDMQDLTDGIYFYRIYNANSQLKNGKIILIK